ALTRGDAGQVLLSPHGTDTLGPFRHSVSRAGVPVGRPPLPLGTSGTILFATMPNGRVKARVKFRDWDGEVRLVSKPAASRAAAERELKTELTVRRAPGGTGALT